MVPVKGEDANWATHALLVLEQLKSLSKAVESLTTRMSIVERLEERAMTLEKRISSLESDRRWAFRLVGGMVLTAIVAVAIGKFVS